MNCSNCCSKKYKKREDSEEIKRLKKIYNRTCYLLNKIYNLIKKDFKTDDIKAKLNLAKSLIKSPRISSFYEEDKSDEKLKNDVVKALFAVIDKVITVNLKDSNDDSLKLDKLKLYMNEVKSNQIESLDLLLEKIINKLIKYCKIESFEVEFNNQKIINYNEYGMIKIKNIFIKNSVELEQ